MDDDAILAYWATTATASGYRTRTTREHLISLRATLRRTGKSILSMTRHDLIGDLGREGLAPATRARYKSLFHGFWSWVQEEGFRLDNPAVRLPRTIVHKKEANPIETDDLEIVINSGIYAKTRMYVLLYAYQGFRASEIAAVHGSMSIDWTNRRILSREAKGGKEVWRPMHPLIWEQAQRYPRDAWWFPSPSNSDEHITGKNVSTVLSKAFKRAGITGHRPHNLRAWYATNLDLAGAPTTVVAAGLRHSDLQSASRYIAVPQQQIERYQDMLPVISVPERTPRGEAARRRAA
ncbi:integrase [Leucobacter sp. Psy1]|uniref:tyrosine-type recombinase/integrase n=1 Tax=Leucobacter sp. Psy1 TaxID=2875729 RepID=UPI001CD59645|nr:tyrosine-type recombinase/integrase [Leucobacter sp. Psy1]UBH06492.1 integrase [Leucobacter sp. Psy1]